jgi:hypothetical protein
MHTFPRNYFVSSPVRQLTNGRLILGLYFAEPNQRSRGAVVTSDDGGKTWNGIVDLDCPKVSLDAETDVIELGPGHLYAALRDSFGPMHESFSQDNGDTWSTPKPVNFLAHCPYLHRAPDGAILLGYREATPAALEVLEAGQWAPDDSYRTALRISRNNCRTWSKSQQIDKVGGAYTSMVNLPDDSILVVYYEERPGADIRAKRFRVTKSGIEFLPVDSQ